MFGANLAKQYPHLVEFINQANRPQPVGANVITGGSLIGFGVVSGVVGLILGAGLLALAAFIPVVGGIGMLLGNRKPNPSNAEALRKAEVQKVMKSFKGMIDHHRLHRDLDSNSLLLLEECAHHWMRVKIAFSTGQWQEENLPHSYFVAKENAKRAATEAMEDVMLAYQFVLPENVSGRNPMDYVDEALETFSLKRRDEMSRTVPSCFFTAREVADRLRLLAEEAEHLAFQSQQLSGHRPGRTLDAALSDLRDLRHAEDELQDHVENRLG